jgi:peptidoglycan/LPS O-acetylase OafA/YrhL
VVAALGPADAEMGAAVVERVDPGPRRAPTVEPSQATVSRATGDGAAGGPRGDGDRPRLAHQPALDGLRGLAVLAVLLFHLERLDGGFLGVDLFFVLSGFLITSLLAVEHRARGAVDLGRFWARRARRLLPALLVLLVGVSVLLLTFTPTDQRGRFRGDALATLGYVANWHRMSIDLGYWDIFEQPSPLDHTWSLAIEEQFYVVWPLVAVAVLGLGARRRRGRGSGAASEAPGNGAGAQAGRPAAGDRGGRQRVVPASDPADDPRAVRSAGGAATRRLGWVALAGAGASFGVMALTYSPVETDRAYYGTDTRIGATLLGAALALLTTRSAGAGRGRAAPVPDPPAATGLVSCQPDPPRVRRPNDAAGDVPDSPDASPDVADRTLAGEPDGAGPALAAAVTVTAVGDAVSAPTATSRRTPLPAGGRARRWWVEGAGVVGLAWMAWSAVTVDGLSPWYYRGGLLLFAVAALAVIHAVTTTGSTATGTAAGGSALPPGTLARVVGWAPLRGLGVISYGVYLWHWPVDVYLTPERAGFGGWPLDGLRLAATLAVALGSFWLVEQPIRRGALPGRASWAAGGGALVVTLAAVLVATAGAPATVGGDTTDDPALGFGPVPVEGSDNPYLLYPAEIPPDATRVLVVGDSGAYHLGPILAEEGAEAGFAVASSAPYWCNVALPEGLLRFDDGEIMDRGDCQDERRRVLRDLVDELRPHAVVYYLANASGPGEIRVGGEWTMDCEPAYDDHLTRALQADVDLLSARGARVVLATSPYTNVLDDRADERTDCRNATFRRVAASRPGRAAVVDMNAYVAAQREAGVEMFMDLVHLSPEGSRRVSGWLFPQLRTLAGTPR